MTKDPFEKQLDSGTIFKSDLLSGLNHAKWPDRIDYVASQLTHGEYVIGVQSANPQYLMDGYDLDKAARDHYLRGIAALTGDTSRMSSLPANFRLGDLLVEFSGLREGLEEVDRSDVPPGEVLSRTIMRTVQRQTSGKEAQLARQLRADTETPRELVAELTTVPELASLVESALPDPQDSATLTTELASLDLTTELWDHQLESLALWLHHGMNAYVDMATATGKTVLGLATVAHAVDSGSLHPADQKRLEAIFDDDLPEPPRNRPNNVLIVTTDDLLGVQWARLFQDHCHTPPAFTNVDDAGIQLPWGRIDIRSARGMSDVDPSDYRLAIFDEVHNYSGRSGWGDYLIEFVESSCPVLALTGSVTNQLESLVSQLDRPFPLIYRYTHELALADGVIPDFKWTLTFIDVADSETLTQFAKTAHQFERLIEYDGTYRLEADALTDEAPNLSEDVVAEATGDYVSGSALAQGLRETGEDGTASTESLETLASGISNRTIHRLNLRANLDPVIEVIIEAVTEKRPALVLTRSYAEAMEIEQALNDQIDDCIVERLDAGQSAAEHDGIIQSFDETDTDKKVLLGPGKRIGQGNDIQTVEVGINIARSGSGVNATLVQRLGRLLRDAGGKDTVDFYHIIGVPPSEATITPDGESFVRTIAEFFGQVLEPDTDGILKLPAVSIGENVNSDVAALEQQGAPCILSDEQSTAVESAYAAAICERSERTNTTVDTDWFSAAFSDEARLTAREHVGAGRVRNETGGPGTDSNTNSKRAGEAELHVDDGDRSENTDDTIEADETTLDHSDEIRDEIAAQFDIDATDQVSPLVEHFEAFRSLAIIHEALRQTTASNIPHTDPLQRWVEDVRAITMEAGFEDQEAGYGKQVNDSPFSIPEYREKYGTGHRVTEFEVVSVCHPSKAVIVLFSESLSDLSSWVVPVTPESNVPLPIIVESETELERGRKLLREFPAIPPVIVED